MVIFLGPIIVARPPPVAGTVTPPAAALAGLPFVDDKGMLKNHDKQAAVQRLSEYVAADLSDQDQLALVIARHNVMERQDSGINMGLAIGCVLIFVQGFRRGSRRAGPFYPSITRPGQIASRGAGALTEKPVARDNHFGFLVQAVGTVGLCVYAGSKIAFRNGQDTYQRDLNTANSDTMEKFRQAWAKTIEDLSSSSPPTKAYHFMESDKETQKRDFEKLMEQERRGR